MAKPRKQTYTMDMFLEKINDKDIRNDSDTQRQFVWSNEQVNELIMTVLSEDYIPPIILGEEDSAQLWIVDGGQRSGSFRKFRYGNYKITSAIEDSVISYRAKVRDDQGNAVVDTEGNILWEDAAFDMKNKTYEQLPDELKKRFNEYQVETVIHEHCDSHHISQLIKRYNNHTSMNTSQKAFTYIDHFAREIRRITESRFFMDYSDFKEKEKNKGVLERVVIETVMCMNHLDNWKKQTKAICNFLNQNAAKAEFERLEEHLHRLEKVISEDVKELFNSKDAFIWLTLFDKFAGLGIADSKFVEFLRAFKNGLRKKAVDGRLFDEVDKGKGTKDKAVIVAKLHILETIMYEFLHISNENSEVDVLEYIKENINPGTTPDDIELYEEMCKDYFVEIDESSKVRDENNKPSMLMLIAYACEEEQDQCIKDWIVDFDRRNTTYIRDQTENYLYMKQDLDLFAACT